MAYQPLRVARRTPKNVLTFLRDHVDMEFHDVHCMLRLPLKSKGLDAGCNFAAASFLLSLVAGLSTALFRQTGYDGERFREMLENFYPWDVEPAGAVRKRSDGSAILYQLFRNPLAHALGLDTKQVGGGSSKVVVLSTDRRRVRLDVAKGRLSERKLEQLEGSVTRPKWARGTIIMDRRRRKLLVPGLYWGVREMVRRLTHDRARMADANRFLRRWRNAV